MDNLRKQAFIKKLFVTDGLEMVRTEPKGKEFVGFIRNISPLETEVPYNNITLNDTLRDGKEVTEKEYNSFKPHLSDE